MTNALEQLLGAPPPPREFEVLRAALVELRVTDLDASVSFYSELLGMIVSERTSDAAFLRGWEERQHHSLVLRQADAPAVARLGLRVRSESDLDALALLFAARELPHDWAPAGSEPGLGRALRAWDPMGYPLEFFCEIAQFETQHQRFDLHRGAPLLRFDHLNFHCPQVEEAFGFYHDELGFRCSEYISTDRQPEQVTGLWLYRKPNVHDIALTAGTGPRMHHFAYWVAEPAGVLRACDQLAGACRSEVIERGPGRHGVSNAFFVYLRDPDGHRIELYSCDYWTGDPDHRPLRWSVNDPRCRSFWGTRAPDSWYEESSLVLGPDGEPAPLAAAGVDERDQRSEVLA